MPSEALTRCLIASGVGTPPPKKAKKKEDLPAEGVEVWDRLGKAGCVCSKRTLSLNINSAAILNEALGMPGVRVCVCSNISYL